MNKKIRAVMMVAAIALVAGANMFNSQRTIDMSGIALLNVEALADEEGEFIQVCPIQGGYCNVLIGGQTAVSVAGWQK